MQKTNPTELRAETVINQKNVKKKQTKQKKINYLSGKLILQKNDNSFNSWIDKKDIVKLNELFSRIMYP